MKKMLMIAAAVFLLIALIVAEENGCLSTIVNVKVVDENGIPVKQAEVEIIFSNAKSKGPGQGWGLDVKYDKKKGLTDGNGTFSASGSTNMDIPISAVKSGYYESSGGVSFDKNKKPDKDLVVIPLKNIRNPVPMFAKKVNSVWEISKIPVFKQDIGYDLEVGDWVAPHGKGKIADFIFNVDAEENGPKKDRKCFYTLTFSNEKDGIQEYLFDKKEQSSYKWLYEVPTDGYSDKLEKTEMVTSGKRETNIKLDKEINYIFRVRTKLDEKRNIVEAKYGKIEGEITIFSNGYIQFNYYFNPSGNRSLEFDTEKNLFIPEGAKRWKEQYNNYINFGP